MLCSFGREIVSELQNRVSALVPAIKQDIEKNKSKNPVDVEQELSQIQELFNSLMEVIVNFELYVLLFYFLRSGCESIYCS
jgi:predicted PurR-regulated permease PerM